MQMRPTVPHDGLLLFTLLSIIIKPLTLAETDRNDCSDQGCISRKMYQIISRSSSCHISGLLLIDILYKNILHHTGSRLRLLG